MSTRTDQLRVRLKPEERQQLEQAIAKRGKSETISDVIRDALHWLLSPKANQQPVHINNTAYTKLESIARKLRRDPAQVVEDMIASIEAGARGHTMLIIEELKLQEQYSNGQPLQRKAA